MEKEIKKHVKIKYYRSSCKKELAADRQIITVKADFKVSDISKKIAFKDLLFCLDHPTETPGISFSFYHEEKPFKK
jgi:hypothetical protein